MSYTVTYNGNGNTGGILPVDNNSYASGSKCTVLSNVNYAVDYSRLVKTIYSFKNWNTASDGTGDTVIPYQTLVITGNVTLYAQWFRTYTQDGNNGTGSGAIIFYNGVSNTSGNPPIDSNNPYNDNGSLFAPIILGTGTMVKTGYTFDGWVRVNDYSAKVHQPGEYSEQLWGGPYEFKAQWIENSGFTVTYHGNQHSSGTAPVDSQSYTSGSTFTVLAKPTNLEKNGFYFDGWNTATDGSGTTYSPGDDTNEITEDLLLYAVWTPVVTYTVTYHGNQHSSGTAPVDSQSYTSGSTFTVQENTVNLEKNGFYFDGWNTATDGSGTTYSPGDDTNEITEDLLLYAVWTPVVTYTVTYHGNQHSSGTAPVDSESYTSGSTFTVQENTVNLEKNGFYFDGWNTATDGSGTTYSPGDDTNEITEDLLLYAVWTPVVTYTVTYHGNQHSSGTAPVDSESYTSGSTVNVLAKPAALVKTGFVFGGWNTAANGKGTNYSVTPPGNTFEISSNIILYAKWTPVVVVTYNGNGGGGTSPVDSKSYTSGSTVKVLAKPAALVKTGFVFGGWNTAANGKGTNYSVTPPGNTFKISSNITLYAKWTPR
jgi:uncharacterized repeat protein (TIGR02543 family)